MEIARLDHTGATLGAKLAHSTGNQTYADQASATYDALTRIGLVADDFSVYDGAHAPDCDDINKVQWSYTAGALVQGAAYMYNLVSFQGKPPTYLPT